MYQLTDTHTQTFDHLVEERAIAIEINQVNYAVMLCTPHELEDFVLGFLYSEQVISHNRDIHDIEISNTQDASIVSITIANRCFTAMQEKQRLLKGTTGCGICGTQSLTHAFPKLATLPTDLFVPETIQSAFINIRDELAKWQTKAQQSGALHAAFWLDANGNIVLCREDIGRHNAMDKLIGALMQQTSSNNEFDNLNGALLVTSRCSVELVQKAIRAKIRVLASLSSPSQFAVKLALEHNLTLVHVPKHDRPIYFGQE